MTERRSLCALRHIPTLSDRGDDVPRGLEADGVACEDNKLVSVVKVDRALTSGLAVV